ncbi:hypothetical protein NLI96_g8059 [Meripilus lineatus]|uniref:Uncharacterized protein n=1 Tax=Meripilus lineatus TaxID=2056292 RepID=A0AAD5YCC8_9APHY|nr:hypothetical protein NLI96_g8059 [Physisporinus lineatus]
MYKTVPRERRETRPTAISFDGSQLTVVVPPDPKVESVYRIMLPHLWGEGFKVHSRVLAQHAETRPANFRKVDRIQGDEARNVDRTFRDLKRYIFRARINCSHVSIRKGWSSGSWGKRSKGVTMFGGATGEVAGQVRSLPFRDGPNSNSQFAGHTVNFGSHYLFKCQDKKCKVRKRIR